MQISQLNKHIHINDYIAILRNRRWMVVSFFLITVITVTLASFIQKPVYRASATVIVDVESPDILSVRDVVKLGETNYFAYRDYIETQKEIIRSRSTARQIMQNLGLADKKQFKESKDPLGALLKKMSVELVRDTRILAISVDDQDPELASLIANEFAKVYTDSNLALKMEMSNQAQAWLRKEVEAQKQKVKGSELELHAYKEENDIISVEAQQTVMNDALVRLNASYLDAQKTRIKAETTFKSLVDKEGTVTLENLPTLLTDNKTLEKLKDDYLKQELVLAEYEKVYKHKHPKMIRLLESMNQAKSRIKSEIETDYNSASEEEDMFKRELEEQRKRALEFGRKVIKYNELKRELETNERILEIVLNRLKETAISSQIQTNNVRVHDLAEIRQYFIGFLRHLPG